MSTTKIKREELARRIREAVKLAVRYGGVDGAHHKDWVIDQMVRLLCGDVYDDVIKTACAGVDGTPDAYTWETGVAP